MNAYTFTSTFLTAEMMKPHDPCVATIKEVMAVKFKREEGDEVKPVVYFEDEGFPFPGKGMSLNKSNLKTLIALYGTPDTDEWKGRKVTIVVRPTLYKGKETEGLRLEKGE